MYICIYIRQALTYMRPRQAAILIQPLEKGEENMIEIMIWPSVCNCLICCSNGLLIIS